MAACPASPLRFAASQFGVSRTRCLWQEASKYGTRTAAPAPAPVATAKGGLFTAYGQDRYTPVLPTELAEDRDVLHLGVFRGVEDLEDLGSSAAPPALPPGADPRFHDDTEGEGELEGEGGRGEEEDEEEELSDDTDGEEDLMWFDGHEGVSGDFTKTFKAEIAGNRPNSAATQANVLLARARRAAGGGGGGGGGAVEKQALLRKFQPSARRNDKAERRICTQSLNEKRLHELADSVHKGVFGGGGGGDKAARGRGVKDKADRATTEQVLDPRTRLVLYKLLNKETLSAIHGCVSTGKEANVYYATTPTAFLDANQVRSGSTVTHQTLQFLA